MKLMNHIPATLMLAGLALSSAASAALFTRPGGMVYDSGLDLTWLADANYARTSGHDADGRMTWQNAVDWASNLVYGGYSDWRLPTTLQPDASCSGQFGGFSYGFGCTGGELGHLFYTELGATAGNSILTGNPTELAKFSNIQSPAYWSGTEYARFPFSAWNFYTGHGLQDTDFKASALFAWAVRSGDVAAAVPEPGSLMLLGSGMVAWIGGGWKRRRG